MATRMGVWMTDAELHRAVKVRAAGEGTSVTAWVEAACRLALGRSSALPVAPVATSSKPPRKPKVTTPAASAAPAAEPTCTRCHHLERLHRPDGQRRCERMGCACPRYAEPPAPYPD